MDKEKVMQLEQQIRYFWPFIPLRFWEENRIMFEAFIKKSFEELTEATPDLSSYTEKTPEEINEYIKIIEKQYINGCHVAMEKIWVKMNELTFIPNNLQLFHEDMGDVCLNKKDLLDEEEQLRKELTEQQIFKVLLKQELEEHKQIEPVLKTAEKLNDLIKKLPQNDENQQLKDLLIDITNENPQIKYSLKNFSFNSSNE